MEYKDKNLVIRFRAFLKHTNNNWVHNGDVVEFIKTEKDLWAEETQIKCAWCGSIGKHICQHKYLGNDDSFDNWLINKYQLEI